MRRYMKRSLCIIVTFIMVVLNNFVTPASDINFQKDMIKFRAYLINVNTGEKYMVKTINLPMPRSSEDEMEIGTIIELKKENIIPLYRFRSSGSQENEEFDDSSSVSGIIKIKYQKRNDSDGQEEYLLTNVSGNWKVWEPRGIRLSNRHIAYTCQDAMDFNQVRIKKISSNSFNVRTGFNHWAKEYASGVLGATSFITIKHGAESEWKLAVECNYFDNNILGILGVNDIVK